ncbi:MAG: hypothetical protein SYNGOMJ08_00563 [Candidatus Syntrophoarchaeum sp. GoM_oil]|nr:MAG: hypothetical protein SYNGOMJ08_00563 [Candidatus Syntrophoarchaeum sp. GoM_oil]
MNVEIKRRRHEGTDRKNQLAARIFEKLLEEPSDLGEYCFEDLKLARRRGCMRFVRSCGTFIGEMNDRHNISR